METPESWRCQDMGHLLRKTTGNEQSQPRGEATRAANSKAIGAGLPKPVGAHDRILVMELLDLMSSLLNFGFSSVWFLLSMPPFCPFGLEMLVTFRSR
jgi:hypothetical protein